MRTILFLVFSCYAMTLYSADKQDIRILIDVSGSMQQNDPKNLRVPALELLINLLPVGAKAGIWLFAENTDALMPLQTVTPQWQASALQQVDNIHSRGLLTDIETALQLATADWKRVADTGGQRILILLTDGMVDVSQDFMQSAESRERILSELSRQLQKNKVQVYSIALSVNADSGLLTQLASHTNGWYELAGSAEQLQRVFFKIFQKAITLDTVPLQGNSFMVDASIKEFSVLIFRQADAQLTQLIAPSDTVMTYKSLPTGAKWVAKSAYDLVTVAMPEAGRWQIKGDMDPDNQVMIVTDLQLKTLPLAHYLNVGERLAVEAFFTDAEQLITREDFLNLVDMRLIINKVSEPGQTLKFAEHPDKPGYFLAQLPAFSAEGIYQINIIVNGQTFQRQIMHTVGVLKTALELKSSIDLEQGQANIQLIPDSELIDTNSLHIEAFIYENQAERQSVINEHNQQWQLVVNAPTGEQPTRIRFLVRAQSVSGEAITPDLQDLLLTKEMFALVPTTTTHAPIEGEKTGNMASDAVVQESSDLDTEAADEELLEAAAINWPVTAAVVLALNGVLIALGYFAFRFYKNKLAAKQAELLERLE